MLLLALIIIAYGVVGLTSAASQAEVVIPDTAIPIPRGFTEVPAPPTLTLSVSVGLKPTNTSELPLLIASMYTPGSPNYHRYLPPKQFEQEFGPTRSEYTTVWNYLEARGLTVTRGPGPFSINAYGTISQIEAAFGVQIDLLTNGTITYYVNLNNVTLPVSVGSYVTSVIGLENLTQLTPMLSLPPQFSGLTPMQAIAKEQQVLEQEGVINPNGGLGTPLPQPPYTPQALELAYNETPLLSLSPSPGVYDNGMFITVAVVDAYGDPTIRTDLAQYDLTFNSTNLMQLSFYQCVVGLAEYEVGVGNACNAQVTPYLAVMYPFGIPSVTNAVNSVVQLWEVESAVDVQMAHATAPGANIIEVVTPDAGITLVQGVAFVIANGLANVISQSWGEPDIEAGPFATYMNIYYTMAAAEGITVLAASGDSGAYAPGSNLIDTSWPASEPYVTGVGGTTLFMNGTVVGPTSPISGPPSVPEVINPTGWANETAWTGYSGGGYSPVYPKPIWQNGEGVPTNGRYAGFRGVPDTAANAQFGGNFFYFNGQLAGSYLFGGTSFASPLVAGMVATLDSYLYVQGPLGFINPLLYQILSSPYYHEAVHDITVGNNRVYSAGPGWNPVDGLGTFNVGVLASLLSLYSFSAGAVASKARSGSLGAQVTIQTVIPEDTFGGVDLAYLTIALPNGARLFVGYSESSEYSVEGQDSWFYGVIPPGALFGTNYFTFGPAGSAGINGTWNTYSIIRSGTEWTFYFNGEHLGTYNANTTASASPPAVLATAFGVSNAYNQLGPIHFINLLSMSSTGVFTPLLHGYAIEITQYLDVPPLHQPFTNPYGVEEVSGYDDDFIAGSGMPIATNDSLLWSGATFSSSPPPPTSTSQPTPTGQVLTISTNSLYYNPGQTVVLSGSLEQSGKPLAGEEVGVQVDNPRGAPVFVYQTTTSPNGEFTLSFTLPENSLLGNYSVYVSTAGSFATLNFTVRLPQLPIRIVSVQILNSNQQTHTVFSPGQQILINVTIQLPYSTTIAFLGLVQVIAPGSTPIFVGSVQNTISSGQIISYEFGFTLPSNSASGTYTVQAFVWNGFPATEKANWTSYASPFQTTFSVS